MPQQTVKYGRDHLIYSNIFHTVQSHLLFDHSTLVEFDLLNCTPTALQTMKNEMKTTQLNQRQISNLAFHLFFFF